MLLVLIAVLGISQVFSAAETSPARPVKPHIVYILTDDMGYQDVGFRDSDIITDNLDRLARAGVVLENHYVLPQCAPSRATLMTGRYPIRTGFWMGNISPGEEWGLEPRETTLPEMLKRNGYKTHGVGKWHCGMHSYAYTPGKQGFDTYLGMYLGAQRYSLHENSGYYDLRQTWYENDVFHERIRADLIGRYNTHIFTNRSVEIIEEHDPKTPLFLYLAYNAPHGPLEAPRDDVTRLTAHMTNSSWERKVYATQVAMMDEGVGRVVQALNDSGLLENTVLVFSSDNGAKLGGGYASGSNYPLRDGKGTLYEGGVRGVSFVFSNLLEKTGYVNRNIHHIADWYPTFQALVMDHKQELNADPLPLDGIDIWESISNNSTARSEVLIHLRQLDHVDNLTNLQVSASYDNDLMDFYAIRQNKWKLINGKYRTFGRTNRNNFPLENLTVTEPCFEERTRLYDLIEDPGEHKDLAGSYPHIVEVLLATKDEYIKNITRVSERTSSDKGYLHGAWMPWVD